MVTNDDGIDGAGLQALVQALVSTDQYQVFVCAPETYANFHPYVSIFLVLIIRIMSYLILI